MCVEALTGLEIAAAHELLSDPEKRKQYDTMREFNAKSGGDGSTDGSGAQGFQFDTGPPPNDVPKEFPDYHFPVYISLEHVCEWGAFCRNDPFRSGGTSKCVFPGDDSLSFVRRLREVAGAAAEPTGAGGRRAGRPRARPRIRNRDGSAIPLVDMPEVSGAGVRSAPAEVRRGSSLGSPAAASRSTCHRVRKRG